MLKKIFEFKSLFSRCCQTKKTGFLKHLNYFRNPVFMLLSGLDSKKYQNILRFKRSLKEKPELFDAPILSENATGNNREIDIFGEIAATKVNDRRKNFSQEQIDAIVQLRKSGKTLERLANRFDCCDFAIRKILKKYNAPN